ncbi:MAG: ATP-dependent DNA helicase RecG [Clostridiales bacterium]|nr:ATP-dependent DNA helicase RecG [Clostridiales bacterium]
MNSINDPISVIKGVGEKKARAFALAGINTVRDVVEYYPTRYEYYRYYDSPAHIFEKGNVVFYATYDGTATRQYAKTVGMFIRWRIKTGTTDVMLTWFNQPYILNALQKGKRYCIKCSVEYKKGLWQAVNPKFSSTEEYNQSVLEPVYRSIKGIGQSELQKFIRLGIEHIGGGQECDTLPKLIRERYDVQGYVESLRSVHFPTGEDECIKGNKRLIFEEFFEFRMRQMLSAARRDEGNAAVEVSDNAVAEYESMLPYKLTNAQKKAMDDVLRDLKKQKPMNRMIQGDVGSGKTAVAFAGCWMAKSAGFQSIIMVPTEVLARQHLASFEKTFDGKRITARLLVGSMKVSEKRAVLEGYKNGTVDVLIGTHAVLEENVESENVGLVITDEQHRFGVKQRLNLKNKGKPVNMLVMTATPIPRTLSMVVYGDLDVSVIDELPPDRVPIRTYAVNGTMRERIYKFIVEQVKAGFQAYVICPLIEDEDENKASVKQHFTRLSQNELSEVKTGMLFGSMKADQKDKVMSAFANGEIDVLISTTVIEVGVNVPNATVIVIEDAEKFGLAQLHQLRGRVGRGKEQSHCILISDSNREMAKERLSCLVKTTDGFEIASFDMKLRGQGEYFGLRQHGKEQFRFGDLMRDMEIFTLAADAVEFVKAHKDELGDFYQTAYERAKKLNDEIVFN